ncbi:MAG: hypothetical protein QOD72_3244 [Acidimicrobiaceae bacterium]|nr:hypothetical protein [Acidimicrobiaceae bacterium]
MIHDPVGRVTAAHPAIVKFGRAGWFAKGVVYFLAGGLALLVVGRSFGWSHGTVAAKEASPTGAIKEVARSTGGPLVLVALAAGMFIYAAWRLATAVLPGSTDAEGLATRVGYGVSAILHTTFGATAIALAKSPDAKANGNKTVSDITSRVMQHTTGRWLIGIAGAVTIGAGVYRFAKGAKSDVTNDVDMSGMSAERSRLTRRLGAVGEVGRGIAMGLIGFFLIRAAVTFKPAEATGLDGALRRLALQWWGVIVVAAVGLGLMAYGLFCLVTFTRRRLQAP